MPQFTHAILFAHHRNDETTRRHLDILRQLNKCPVIPIALSDAQPVPDAEVMPPLEANCHRNADRILYRWFEQRAIDAARYIYLEWDAYLNYPAEEHYSSVWDAPLAATSYKIHERGDKWHWFNPAELAKLPAHLRSFAAGVPPLNGVLIGHELLAAIVASDPPLDVFCELRLGTIAASLGVQAMQLPGRGNQWCERDLALAVSDWKAPDLYHPIKRWP